MAWTIERTAPAVSTIRVDMSRNMQWEQWVLLSADRHFDNPRSDRAMQRRHLDMARDRGAFVIDCGDLFCAMQGKYDPRSHKEDVMPENQKGNYLDSLIDSGEKFFGPYADLFAEIGMGNHELSIMTRIESNLCERLVRRLKAAGSKVVEGGYRGWIRMTFIDDRKSNFTQSFNLYYTHGANSNAPVTKGILKTARRAVWLPDADVVVSGHIHEAWAFPIYRNRLSQTGTEYVDKQLHIQLPTYKDEFKDLSIGFHHANERPPKPIGAWWLRFWYDRSAADGGGRIKFEATQAE